LNEPVRRILVIFRQCICVAALLLLISAGETAFAQACNTVTGSPWATCPTWTGPSWTVKPASHPAVTPSIIGTFDFNGDGLSDIFAQSPVGNGGGVAVSTGSSFSTVVSTTGYSVTCYNGNFDGSGRSGQACFDNNAGTPMSYSVSTGTGYSSPTTLDFPNNIL